MDIETSEEAAYQPVTQIKHVIVHTLVKEVGTLGRIDERDDELPIGDLAQRLVDDLHVEYRSRHSKSHGKFDGDEEKAPAQVRAREHLIDGEMSFKAFSTAMAKLLCDKTDRTAATGGHIFFAHLEEGGQEYLLIAILTDETGVALNEEKDLESSVYLNVKGFRFAGRIHINAWRDGVERYVSFLKGTKDVAAYFKAFLGCETAISALKDTQHLSNTIRDFSRHAKIDGEPLSEEARNEFLWKVDQACRKMADDSEPLDIQSFCNEMWPREPNELKRALVEGDFPLNDGFVPHKRGLQNLIHFRGKSKHWKLEFERSALTVNDVIYDDEDKTITLSNLPPDLIARLRDESDSVEV